MSEDGDNVRNPRPLLGAMMAKARAAARASPNRVRQVGAVLLTCDGAEIAAWNTFPAGVRDLDERCEGEARFVWMEHAERRAVFIAARRGAATQGGHLTTTFFPCIDCARAIVDCGIACIDTPAPAFSDPVWGDDFAPSQVILEEGGVEVRIVEQGAPQP
jgi:dCMP deaminase